MMSRRASHVLVCLRYGIGDLVMELPVIDALRRAMPEAVLTGLGAEPAIEILEGDGRFDQIVSMQRWGIRHLGDSADEQNQKAFAAWLASSRFDLILDPSHSASVLTRIMTEAGVETRDSYPAYLDEGLALGMDGLSAVKYGAELGWGLSVPAASYPDVLLREEEIDWASRFLEERNLIDCVGISPGASGHLKRWPVDRFAGLCRHVVEELNTPVLVFGGPAEVDLLRTLTGQACGNHHIATAECLHLRKVAALLSQCRLYVGNDSGLMHLAAASGTPVVVVFGPTVPQIYLPTWVRSRAVVGPVTCSHQPRQAFGHPRCVLSGECFMDSPCMEAIDTAAVCAAVVEEYARRKAW
jgi:ADP-heptose:LPS heptosyltransferase